MNTKNNCIIEGQKNKSFQKGFGFYSLCERCNSITDDLYGKEYVRVTNLVGTSILETPKEAREMFGAKVVVDIEKIDCRVFFNRCCQCFVLLIL